MEEILKAGYKTVDRLIRIAKTQLYPGNSSFITLPSDRNDVERLIKRERFHLDLENAEKPGCQDLRDSLSRSPQESHQHASRGRNARRHERRQDSSLSRRCSNYSRSRSKSGSAESAEISKLARDLPRAHKFICSRLAQNPERKYSLPIFL